jgi:hypothetical protein
MIRRALLVLGMVALGGAISAAEPTEPRFALDLGAMVQPVPLTNRFADPAYFIWCGAPTRTADGRCHLYYSRWPVAAGFHPGWALHSEIAYAVADRPEGPYRHVNVALPARGREFWDGTTTHNPNIVQVNGKFCLFYMGNTGDGKYPEHRNHQRVGVALADRPEGPWTRLDRPIIDVSPDPAAFDSLMVTNPAAAARPDGGILLIYKAAGITPGKPMGGTISYGAALADRPEGPYVKQAGNIFAAEGAAKGKHWMVAEDPFIWYSERYGKRYWAITRDVVGSFSGANGGICLFESLDGLHWSPALQPKVLGRSFAIADGSDSRSTIERPALLLTDGIPTMLFGAMDGYRKHGKISSNVQIPLTVP